jgi:hypothetical protein
MGMLDDMSWGKRILVAIPVVAGLFAWQTYDRAKEAKSTKATMVQMCADDKPCLAAVEQYAEVCFKDNYKMGKRSGIRTDDFVKCVNQRSGSEFFSVGD